MKRILLTGAALLIATPLYAQDLSISGNIRMNSTTATAAAGSGSNAATCNNKACVVTTGTLIINSNNSYDVIVSDNLVAVGDLVVWSLQNGSNTGGVPFQGIADTSVAGRITFRIHNAFGASAFNGTFKITYTLFKQ